MEQRHHPATGVANWLALGGSGAAVLAWAACCVLPIGLSILGLTFAASGWLAGQRWWLTGAAVIAVVVAWALTLRRLYLCRVDASCAAPPRAAILVLTVATALIVLALAWGPLIERPAMLFLRSLS